MAEQPLIKRKTALSDNVVAFCRFLRQHKFRIGPNEEADALKAIAILNPFASPELFKNALNITLVRTYKQQLQFEKLFNQYWRELERALDAKVKDQPDKNKTKPKTKEEAFLAIKNWLSAHKESKQEESIASYSTNETQNTRSFATFNESEQQEIFNLIRKIAKKLARQLSRRTKIDHSHIKLDIKRTLRLNLRRGGEIVDLVYKKQKPDKWQIVLLCDISQSMELYSQFLIQFMYGLQKAYQNIETFVFGTQLTRITKELNEESPEEAIKNINSKVFDWSGGTKIGVSLSSFLEKHGNRMLTNKTITIILSDGWDTGDTETLSQSMASIKRKSGKVIWLNPLAGHPNYSPTVKGMQAALPYIDVFAPFHNLDTLRKLIRYL